MPSRQIITCSCGCGRTGPAGARGWLKSCHGRWIRHGRPVEGPPLPLHMQPRVNREGMNWRDHLSAWGYARTVLDRLMSNIDMAGDCWIWKRSLTDDGYGQISVMRGMIGCHRVSYHLFVGEVPDGLELDHLCRVRACCNPWHLEPVTGDENYRRGIAAVVAGSHQRSKTHCLKGHPYDEANTYVHPVTGHRWCRACRALRMRESNRRKRTEQQGVSHGLV